MQLISLRLLNYRRFKKEEIFFKQDFTLIFWKNWAWKSSIFDAIWFALFGPKWNNFIRENKETEKSFFIKDRSPSKIELIFQYWLKEYKIVRVIDAWVKKLQDDFIKEDKDILIWENLEIIWWDEITLEIEKIIWVSKDTFLKSVFTAQKDLEVLSWNLQDRKNLINKILWLDKIENLIKRLKDEEKLKKTHLEIYNKKLENIDEDWLKNSQKEILLEKELIENNLKTQKKELNIFIKEFEKLKISYLDIDKKRISFLENSKEIEKLESNINIFLSDIESKKNELKAIWEKEIYLKENEFLLKEEENLEKKFLRLQNDFLIFQNLEKLEVELKNLLKEENILNLKQKDFNIWNILKNIEELKIKLQKKELEEKDVFLKNSELKAQLGQITIEWKNLKDNLSDIEKLSTQAHCPTCTQPLWEFFEKLIKKLKEDLEKTRKNYQKINIVFLKNEELKKIIKKEIDDIRKTLEAEEKNQNEVLKNTLNLENLEKNIINIKNKIKDIWEVNFDEKIFLNTKKELEEIKVKTKNYLKISWEVSKKEDLEKKLKENIESIWVFKKTINSKKEELSKLSFKNDEFEEIKRNYFNQFELQKLKNEEILTLEKQNSKKEFELKEIENKLNEIKDILKNIKDFIGELNILIVKQDVLKQYILYLLNYLKPYIEDLASNYFSLITNWKYLNISLDWEYNILIDWKKIWIYSGWEKDLANLCFRLALWQNLSTSKSNPINFLVLDEILASQDKERQQNIIFNLLKLKQKFSQILLVSHIEESKELVESLIEIKKINTDESRVFVY